MVVETKKCKRCGIEKNFSEFPIKVDRRNPSNIKEYVENICKECRSIENKKKYDSLSDELKEEKLNKIKEWQKNNPDKRQTIVNRYHETHKEQEKEYRVVNRDIILERVTAYVLSNRATINSKLRDKRKNPVVKLRHQVSTLVRFNIQGVKCGSILEYLPYSIQELREHFESQFEPWMSWSNWGRYDRKTWDDNDSATWTWQIDHIVPQSDLLYSSMEDDNFRECWALKNLRPYSAKLNSIEGANRLRHKKVGTK